MITFGAVIGEIVGGYRIVSRLGQGGTGEVFAAEHASVGTKAAIKIIAPAFAQDRARVQKYLREAQAASRIPNQGTVKINDVGMPDGSHPFLVMELLQGETLAKRIARTKRLSLTQIAELARSIASVIAALHDENLVHRDLRPEKIVLVRDSGLAQERIKILVGDTTLLGPTGERSAPYAAPEVWRGGGDWRVDIYALGCIIFEMATGQRPYSAPDLGVKHCEHQIPAARSLMPDVPPALDALIARLMGKLVEQRPKSMREISRELDSLAGPGKALAPTVQDQPVLVMGEMEAATLKPGPPIEQRTEFAAPRAAPAKQRSYLPIVIALVVVTVAVVVAALVLA